MTDTLKMAEESKSTEPVLSPSLSPSLSHTENVRQIIGSIRSSGLPENKKRKHFRAKYPNFAESMPKLFDMSVKDNLTPEHELYLNMMLNMSEKLVDKKEIDVIEADKLIYGRLREDYIDPIVKPDKQKVAEFMKQKSYTPEELNNESNINVVQK